MNAAKMMLILVGVWLFQASAWAEVEGCRSLVEKKCGVCHFTKYICPNITEKKGPWVWKRTVSLMMDQGMEATEDEVRQLVDCLSKPGDSILAICH